MVGIEETIGGLPVPVDPHHESCAELRDDALEHGSGELVGSTSLDTGDECLRAADRVREINLPPPPADSQGPEGAADTDDVHMCER